MPPIIMYTRSTCGFCFAAKRLMDSKGVQFEEIDIDEHPERRSEMIERAQGRSTVPQIFIGDLGVGGFDDLSELDHDGELDAMLGIAK